jgi:hypothetical protein
MRFFFGFLLNSNTPPTSKMVSVRESSNCENCMYLLNSWFFHITPEYELDPDFDKTLWGSGSGNFYGSGEGMPDEITVFEKPFAIDIYPTSHMLSSLFQDKYDKSHVNIGSSKGILKITTPDKNVFEFSGAPWYIYCDSEYGYVGHWESYEYFECKEGEYIINWLAEDIIKNQNIYLDATVKWDGYAWKILENKTWSEVSCSIPSSQNCNVNTNCECGITNCQKGWLRLKMPDKIELVKYFSGGEVSFNTGSTTGTATGYMDCLDDMKEYSLSIDVK